LYWADSDSEEEEEEEEEEQQKTRSDLLKIIRKTKIL